MFVFNVIYADRYTSRANQSLHRNIEKQGVVGLNFADVGEKHHSKLVNWLFSALRGLYRRFGQKAVEERLHIVGADEYVMQALEFVCSYLEQEMAWSIWSGINHRATGNKKNCLYRLVADNREATAPLELAASSTPQPKAAR